MVLLNNLTQRLQADNPEEKWIVTGVSWQQYEALIADLGDNSGYRVAYLDLDGVLEIVSPSRHHERGKTRIGDLLLIYFLETDTEYFPTGSTTFRKEDNQAGGEPDESYCIGTEKDFPDLAIEVIVTSGGINRLGLYRRLGVREVWFWQNESSFLDYLREELPFQFQQTSGYERIERSEILPNLNINLLAECLLNSNPLAAAKEVRQRQRSQFNID